MRRARRGRGAGQGRAGVLRMHSERCRGVLLMVQRVVRGKRSFGIDCKGGKRKHRIQWHIGQITSNAHSASAGARLGHLEDWRPATLIRRNTWADLHGDVCCSSCSSCSSLLWQCSRLWWRLSGGIPGGNWQLLGPCWGSTGTSGR